MSKKIVLAFTLLLLFSGTVGVFSKPAATVELTQQHLEESQPPDGDSWLPFVPPEEVTLAFWMVGGIANVDVTIQFPIPNFYITDWGTVTESNHDIWVDSELWLWTGPHFPVVPPPISHTYELGSLENGTYTFTFKAWNNTVKSIQFIITSYEPVHNLNTGLNYTTIQEAIDAPETLDGHVIFVDSGIYQEYVTIWHKSLTLWGEDYDTTVIEGAIAIYPDNVTITGFTIEGSSWDAGIYLDASDNSLISGNIIESNFKNGIELNDSHNNTVIENVISNSGYPWSGIMIWHSNYNLIADNTIVDNSFVGLTLYYSNHTTIIRNRIENNTEVGIGFRFSNENIVYHNDLIDNNKQVSLPVMPPPIPQSLNNTWDNGYPSGGNYWSDYTGVDVKTGPSQDQPSSDGIGDTPYIVDANNTDNYPLMYPRSTLLPPSYNLTIYSSTSGVTFSIDCVPRTTPWSGTYSESSSVSLIMPETHDGFAWSYWFEDGDTNRTKIVTMDTNITLTGVFTPVPPPDATVDIDPDTLNLKSKGRWITCYIELPEGYYMSDIARATILLNGTIPVDPFWVDKPLESVVGDYDEDGIPDLMVKFSRATVSEYIVTQGIHDGNVTLTITGEVDGTPFEGSDTIRVLSKR